MNILISNSTQLPIYEQIREQIKNSIISGELKAGDALPSIRTLAKDLRISVITTKRAYDELEHDGYINTVAGKGCYVSEANAQLMREARLCEIEECVRRILSLSAPLGLTREDISYIFDAVEEENSK